MKSLQMSVSDIDKEVVMVVVLVFSVSSGKWLMMLVQSEKV